MRTLELAPGRVAHASGALWLPEVKTLLIADIHLGYGWALRRRGQLGPVQDPGTRQKLEAVFAELRPESVVWVTWCMRRTRQQWSGSWWKRCYASSLPRLGH
ncbi:MAG: hypothetical protein WKF37_15335 [Bryobacteraceae bacterium]